MTMNQENKERPEVAPMDPSDSDLEKGSLETPETEPQLTMDDKGHHSVTFEQTIDPVVPSYDVAEKRRGRVEYHGSSRETESRRTSYKTKSGHTQGGSKRMSSMEMRRLPVDILLMPASSDNASLLSDDFNAEIEEKEALGERKDLLHMLCLRPGYSLRTQLLFSFGTIIVVTICVVVVICIIVAFLAGQNVKDVSSSSFQKIALETQGLTVRYLAESLTEKLLLVNVVQLIHEATQDRFAGYPSGSDNDVPFLDVLTGEARYPVDFPPPPLEWQFETNINKDNHEEHFQSQNYYRTRDASTASASFLFKGICDPGEVDPLGDAYWPNCTDANNDISVGGVVEPTETTEMIYNKAKDLVPLLKAVYETQDVIRDMGIFFSNDGAGASLNYPHYPISTHSTYISTGCEWMGNANFYDPSRPIGTREMIERCSPENEVVSSRIYSPMERGWCVEQALEPDRIHYDNGPDAWENGFWILIMGRAVYDRITNEFVACIYVSISLGVVEEELQNAIVVEGETLTLIDWGVKGSVIATSNKNSNSTGKASIYDTEVGMSKSDYDDLYNRVNFESKWDPEQVKQAYSSLMESDDYFVSTYPMPSVPNTYDSAYRPLFMVVVSTPKTSITGIADKASRIVDDRVKGINEFCIVAGAIGLLFALLVLVAMADMLTKPLRQMNRIATEIVSNFGDPTVEKAIGNPKYGNFSREVWCTPKTELSDVVKEFNKMVASFSGSHMVKTERHKHHEVYNVFTLHSDFIDLYKGRGDADFAYSFEPPVSANWGNEDAAEEKTMAYVNGGTNMMEDHDTFTTNPTMYPEGKNGTGFSSPLFLWIITLIVTPLLAVNVVITAVALYTVSQEFTKSVETAEDFFLDVEMRKLEVHSRLRADFVSGLTNQATGDLHVLARYAGWLLFGGVPPSDSYRELATGLEECKGYDDVSRCPYVEENEVCDCEWDDTTYTDSCQTYPNGSRQLQQAYWACQSQDSDERGNRLMSSYPATAYSPESTSWWDDQEIVPGFDNASIAQPGYSTLFHRLRAVSAIPVFEAIYNYHEIKDSTIASYVAFELDGLFVGYEGCSTAYHVNLKDFQSTVKNGAANLRPELCPLGKFGYDPRCRGWYDTGKNLATTGGAYLHITAPYEFANTGKKLSFAQSATIPLMDPMTGDHVGQALLDFLPTTMIQSLRNETPLSTGGFPILITTEGAYDADTIIGPNYELSDPPTPIKAKVLPFDINCAKEECISNLVAFNDFVLGMKGGTIGSETTTRTTEDGDLERLFMAYAPVTVRSYRPIDSTDFSRGLATAEYLIYSLALVETKSGLLMTFDPIEKETQKQVKWATGFLSALLVVATLLVVYVSLRVTQSISEPMIYLLDMIRSIRKAESEEPPDFRRVKASEEIAKFSDSIEMLSKIVRSANTAFYAGDFEVAYYVLRDALRLFRRLDNKKAIGIACNNLGNTMMGMYHAATRDGLDKLAGLTRRQIVMKGIAFFHEAIQMGEKAYDEFHDLHGWTPICLDFMQHLSNRYFNRGLFLLSVKEIHEKPDELEELGKRDLQIASDMDSEVVAYGEDIGWEVKDRIEKIFEVKIVRAGGYNLLLEMGYDDEWEVREVLDGAFAIINAEKKHPNSALFARVTRAGRMQEFDTEIMKYYQATGDVMVATKVGIRCLFEDEKVFADTQARAIEVLLQYLEKIPGYTEAKRCRIKNTLQDYMDILEDAVNHQKQTSINEMESDVITKATGGSGKIRSFSSRSWSLEQSSGRFVTMEDF